MARDYRAIPATSASSERIFSYTRNLIIKKRIKMANKNIYYMIYLRNWDILVESDKKKEILFDNENWRLDLIKLEKKIIIV
jgi:hypothetical protein